MSSPSLATQAMQIFDALVASQGLHLAPDYRFEPIQLFINQVNLTSYLGPEFAVVRICAAVYYLFLNGQKTSAERGYYIGQIMRGILQLRKRSDLLMKIDLVVSALLLVSWRLD